MDRLREYNAEVRKSGVSSYQYAMYDISDSSGGSSSTNHVVPHRTNSPQTYQMSNPRGMSQSQGDGIRNAYPARGQRDVAIAPRLPYQDLYPQSDLTDTAFHDEWKEEWNHVWDINHALDSSANRTESNAAYPHHIQGDSTVSTQLDSLWTPNTLAGSNAESLYPQASPSSIRGTSHNGQWDFGSVGGSLPTPGSFMHGVPERRSYQRDTPNFVLESTSRVSPEHDVRMIQQTGAFHEQYAYRPVSSPSASHTQETAFARKPDTSNTTYSQGQEIHDWIT